VVLPLQDAVDLWEPGDKLLLLLLSAKQRRHLLLQVADDVRMHLQEEGEGEEEESRGRCRWRKRRRRRRRLAESNKGPNAKTSSTFFDLHVMKTIKSVGG